MLTDKAPFYLTLRLIEEDEEDECDYIVQYYIVLRSTDKSIGLLTETDYGFEITFDGSDAKHYPGCFHTATHCILTYIQNNT